MKLYPSLARTPRLETLARELSTLTVEECWTRRRLGDNDALRSPTGGIPASEADLRKIADTLTDVAQRHGYPDERRAATTCDGEWGVLLHQSMQISPHEAANNGIWHFMTCILVPDLVRWRWGATEGGNLSERWVTARREGRNCFGRLWWRAEILRNPDLPGDYSLLGRLGEDEAVQIFERPNLAGHRHISRGLAATLLGHAERNPGTNRSTLFREVTKRLLRYGAFIEFQALSDDDAVGLVAQVVQETRARADNIPDLAAG